jgi:enoyl-CoA hydratase/carnithine racemase
VLRLGQALSPLDALTLESVSYSMLLGGVEFAEWLRTRPSRRPRSDEGDLVLVRREGNSLCITLNRPHVHNAYNAALRDALVDALRLARADAELNPVVLQGAGPSFSSGGDLTEFGTTDDLAFGHVVRTTRSAAAELYLIRERVLARVHGACIGAGIELAAFAHRVVADPDTRFRLPEVEMGLIPGAGGTVSVAMRLGRQRALLFALCGATIDAATALRCGLIDAIGPQ